MRNSSVKLFITHFLYCVSDSIQSEPTRSSSASENLPFSISRLLSKPFENNSKLSHAASAAAAAAVVMGVTATVVNGHTNHHMHNHLHNNNNNSNDNCNGPDMDKVSVADQLQHHHNNHHHHSHHQLLVDAAAAEHKFAAQLAHAGIPYSTASALYSSYHHHPALYVSSLQQQQQQSSTQGAGNNGSGGNTANVGTNGNTVTTGSGQVLRVPPQRTPLSWALPPMHPAALAHQAVKDRLAGIYVCLYEYGVFRKRSLKLYGL